MTDLAEIKGEDAMTRRRTGTRWSEQNGRTRFEEWEGPIAQAVVFRDESEANPDVDDVEFSKGGGLGRVRLEFVDDPDASEGPVSEENNAIWELQPQDVFKDMKTHPYFQPSGSIAPELLAADDSIRKGEVFDWSEYFWTTQLERYYGLRLQGVQGYNVSLAVLTKRVTVSKRSTITGTYDNVNRVVPLSEINPPEAIIGRLNEITSLKAWAGQDIDLDNPPLEQIDWEWLKRFPTIRAVAGARRFEITSVWWGAEQWSKVFYGGTWDPLPAI